MKDKFLNLIPMVAAYILNVLAGIDQTVNAILFGKRDHTISGRCGYHATKGNKFALLLEFFIDCLFFWQVYHCRKSIEWDEVEPYDGIRVLPFSVPFLVKAIIGVLEWLCVFFLIWPYIS